MDQFFANSPFTLVASAVNAACWSGRDSVRQRLERLCHSYSKRPDSSLDMIWANFGSGKSHALFYLAHLVKERCGENIISAFVEMPDQLQHFIDLYRRIVLNLPLSKISKLVLDTLPPTSNPNLVRAAAALVHGSSFEKALAEQWLHAERPHLRDLKKATNIDTRIDNDAIACDVLSDMITSMAKSGLRLLLLLDEFQRVRILPQRARNSLLSNLRSLFTRNATGLAVVLAVGSRVESSATELLPPELLSLMGMRPPVPLPEFSEAEARDFLLGRLAFFRPPGYSGAPSAPFGPIAIDKTLALIHSKNTARLIPRTILQTFGNLYDEASIDKNGEMKLQQVQDLLDELRWDEQAGT
jgi:hypothetical protein